MPTSTTWSTTPTTPTPSGPSSTAITFARAALARTLSDCRTPMTMVVSNKDASDRQSTSARDAPEFPAASSTRFPGQQLEDGDEPPTAARCKGRALLGHPKPGPSLRTQQFVQLGPRVTGIGLVPERLAAARVAFVGERGRAGRHVRGNVSISGVPVEFRPELPEARALERGRVLLGRSEAQE